MAARALWKAILDLGEVQLPVKLYAAAEDRQVHFRLLHREDHIPVKQQLIDPRTGREVPGEEIRWGLEVEEGRLILLTSEELERAKPKPSRSIEVTRFVPHQAVDAAWFRRGSRAKKRD